MGIVIGIDVMILSAFAITLTLVSAIVSKVLVFTSEAGWIAVTATALTGLLMIVCYIIMAHVLDYMLGAFGW